MTRGANRKTRGPGRRLLEIGKDLLIAALVLVNLTLAIMCLPSKTLTQTKWLAGALRPFAGLFGLNEAELTYTAPATGSTIVGAAQPLIITLSTEAGRQSAQYDFAALDELYGQYGSLLAQALESAETPQTCTRTEFYAALRGTGAAFCFPGAISPSVLGAWLNVRAPEGGQAQWYVLAQEEDGVTLYLAGEQFSAYFEGLPVDFERAERLVAVGGTVTTLVALVHELEPYDSSFVHLRELSMEQISAAIERMSTLDVEGIAALPGVQPKRAGVILAGAVVIRELMRAGGYDILTVSENSLLAGMAATINEVLDGATPTIAWTPSLSAL